MVDGQIDLFYFVTDYQPWSSGYGKRLKFQRSWVRFPALYTGWTFFTFICCKNCKVCLKRPKINEKEAGVGPFLKKTITSFLQVDYENLYDEPYRPTQ